MVILEVRSVVELHQIAFFEHTCIAVVVRVISVLSCGDQREVGSAERPIFLEHVLGVGLQFVFMHARFGVAHRLHNAEAGDARGLANDGDFTRALHGSEVVHDGIEILHLALRRGLLQFGDEGRLARIAAIPRVLTIGGPQSRGVALRLAAEDLGRERSVDRAMLCGNRRDRSSELRARQSRINAQGFGGLHSRRHAGAVHAVVLAVGPRIQEDRCLLRASVDNDAGARLSDSAEIKELTVLTERHLTGRLGCAQYDGDAFADLRHDLRASSSEFLGRKNLGAAKYRLRQQQRGAQQKTKHHDFILWPSAAARGFRWGPSLSPGWSGILLVKLSLADQVLDRSWMTAHPEVGRFFSR